MAGRNRVSDPRTSTAANRQSFVKNHASERHDANNWHRDWDRHSAHFHNNRVFVFIGGFWWGLYPWDYYPYDAYGYPNDYYNSYPYDYYNGYPYSYYDSSYPSDYEDQPSYAGSQQSVANATVSAVQSELAKLGYYNGPIDGVLGDETEAALARYQQDQDISVTGTVDAATLQSLGIR
jgi:His-Xaa-Ser repeat protein HxsA